MLDWREDCLERLTRPAHTREQVFAELASMTRELDFEFCSLGVQVPVSEQNAKQWWSTDYPKQWADQYFDKNYLTIDPAIRTAIASPHPIVWDDALFATQPEFWEDARAHRVRHGWIWAVRGKYGATSVISLARSDDALSSRELAACEAKLIWLSHTAAGVIGNLDDAPRIQELSAREREILRWTAAGKTSAEVAKILGLATRTVNFHVNTVLVKLDAVNKTQAVAKAIVFGLLY